MPFRSGSVSYQRFRVQGPAPRRVDETLFQTLSQHVLGAFGSDGGPGQEGLRAGWCAGRHVLDTDFSMEKNAFEGSLLAAIRVDAAKVPATVRRAYAAIAEGDPRTPRKAARDEADRRGRADVADGRWTRVGMVPFVWDLGSGALLAPVAGDALREAVRGLFERSVGCRVERMGAGAVAASLLPEGRVSDLDDLRPESLGQVPAGAESAGPPVPWARAAGDGRDFLGNEFLLWLWWRSDVHGGEVETDGGTVDVRLQRSLDLECAHGVGGSTSLRGDAPADSTEAGRALLAGKWPRRAGLLVQSQGVGFECVLQADRFAISGLRLPPAEGPRGGRTALETRLGQVALFDETLNALFRAFLSLRTGAGWRSTAESWRTWVRERGVAAARAPRPEAALAT